MEPEMNETKRNLDDLTAAVRNLGSEYLDLRKQLNSVEALVIDIREVLRSFNWELLKCMKGKEPYSVYGFSLEDVDLLFKKLFDLLSRI